MTSNTQIPIKKANVFYYDELVIRSIGDKEYNINRGEFRLERIGE